MRLGRIDDAVRYVNRGRTGTRSAPKSGLVSADGSRKGDVAGAEQSLPSGYAVRSPPIASYLYNYGWILDQQDRRAEAAVYYERAIASSPLSFEAMNNLALIEAARGRSARALALLNRQWHPIRKMRHLSSTAAITTSPFVNGRKPLPTMRSALS